LEQPKSKQIRQFLNTSEMAENRVLFIIDDYDKNFYLSARNLPKVQVVPVGELNAYAVANARFVLVTESAIEKMEEVLS